MKRILSYKKEIIIILVALLILGGIVLFASSNIGNTNIKFVTLNEKEIPRKITLEIIPQYRDLERAMACVCEDNIYVMVFRGVKPCAGYEVQISKLKLESKENKTNLKVYVNFIDPEKSENMPQVKTYPAAVAKADITGLPDTIELISEYVK